MLITIVILLQESAIGVLSDPSCLRENLCFYSVYCQWQTFFLHFFAKKKRPSLIMIGIMASMQSSVIFLTTKLILWKKTSNKASSTDIEMQYRKGATVAISCSLQKCINKGWKVYKAPAVYNSSLWHYGYSFVDGSRNKVTAQTNFFLPALFWKEWWKLWLTSL